MAETPAPAPAPAAAAPAAAALKKGALVRLNAKAYAGSLASKLNEHLDAYLVVGSCETTVTVGHLTERVRRH